MNISCLEELQMKLDLCLSHEERLDILKDSGNKTDANDWFIVTDDGQCHLFDKDGMLDDISKITELYESYVRKDIKRICIPDSVIFISNWVFYRCHALMSVMIPNTVTHIGNYAFYGCSGLTNVTIDNGVTSIESYAFYGCSGLTSMTIPDSVMRIGYEAFERCSRLTNITFKGKTLEQVKAMDNYPWGIEDKTIICVE